MHWAGLHSAVSTPTHNHGPVDVTDIATAFALLTPHTALPLTTAKLATSVNWSVGQLQREKIEQRTGKANK